MTRPSNPPGRTPGYPEKQPRDREDARRPTPSKTPDREEGGLERDPTEDGTHEKD